MRTAAELDAGTLVGGYRIEALVGRGGMGIVYRATQLGLDRVVALKLVAPEIAHDPGFRDRFLREARLAASLDHPNVLPVHEAGEDDGRLFLSMRLVTGEDLGVLLARGPLEPERATTLAAQVASALDAAHARGLVHRDVKPQNVLVEQRDGREHAYLCDFGLAKSALDGTALTRTGAFLGTLDYASPEQIRGETVDQRSDIYALSCVLYQALTGSVPFPHKDELAKLWAHLHEEPVPPSVLRSTLPGALDGVLVRGLAKDPRDRQRTAGELGEAALAATREPGRRKAVPRLRLRRAAKRRVALLVALGAVAALTATLVATSGLVERGGGAGELSPDREAAPSTGPRVGAPIDVGTPPTDIAVVNGIAFVAPTDGDRLTRIDARSEEVLGTTDRLDHGLVALAPSSDAVWVANSQGWVGRVDAPSGELGDARTLVGDFAAELRPTDIAYGFESVWVLLAPGSGQSSVARIDPVSQQVIAEVPDTGKGARAISAGAGAVWILSDDGVIRVDPGTNAVSGRPIRVGEDARDLAAGPDAVWVVRASDDTVLRIDPGLGEVVGSPIRVGHAPSAVAVHPSGVWVANTEDGTVSRIDPKTRSVVGQPIPLGAAPTALAVAAGSVWAASDDGTVTRIDPGA